MADSSGNPKDSQIAEYVPRPTLGSLLAKDIFVFGVASSVVMIWIVYIFVFALADDGTNSEGGLSAAQMFIVFLLMTAGDIGILWWRVNTLSTFAKRGIESTAKIVGIKAEGDYIGVDYEFSYQGAVMKGGAGLGGFASKKKAERFIGRHVAILIHPDNPKKTMMLTKLK